MMLSNAATLGHDFVHESAVLGRRKVARILPLVGSKPAAPQVFVMLHPFAGSRSSWISQAPAVMAQLAQDCLVVLPECGRKWFINDHAGARYEDYLVQELIPSAREKYGCDGPVSIGGFSMGGASAFFLALRHPEFFRAALSVSGAFFAGDREGDPYQAVRTNALMMPTEDEHERVWGPVGSSVRTRYAPAAMVGQIKRNSSRPKFYFEVGSDDFSRVVEASQRMRDLLADAGAAFEFTCESGDHSWSYAASGMARLIEKWKELSL
jgi:putative tributyrin esterase